MQRASEKLGILHKPRKVVDTFQVGIGIGISKCKLTDEGRQKLYLYKSGLNWVIVDKRPLYGIKNTYEYKLMAYPPN